MNNLKNYFLYAVFLFSFGSFVGGEAKAKAVSSPISQHISDRILLEIDNVYYSQRQLEVYFFVRDVLTESEGRKVGIVSELNWADTLEEYFLEMLIYQETQKVGSFFPRESAIDLAKQRLYSKIAEFPNLRLRAEYLGVERKEQIAVAAVVLQVQAFRRSKLQNAIEGKDYWKKTLRTKYVIRNFENSEKYLKLRGL